MRYFQENIITNLDVKIESPAVLTGYIPDNSPEIDKNRKHPAVLILPGGGYGFTSDRESESIALKMISEGISAFVLRYHVAPVRFPVALCEALLSIKYIREHANEYNIDPANISVCGFSAGGHLAASTGVHWNSSYIIDLLGEATAEWKPNKLILSYPVITSGEHAHRGSFDNLLGEEKETQEWLNFYSLEKQVNKDTPISFIWHTYEDDLVPVQNAMLFASALIEHKIPTELHIYRRGWHGLSLGNYMVCGDWKYKDKHVSSDWIEKAIQFIYD